MIWQPSTKMSCNLSRGLSKPVTLLLDTCGNGHDSPDDTIHGAVDHEREAADN